MKRFAFFIVGLWLLGVAVPTQAQFRKQYLTKGWQFADGNSGNWMPATVPGTVHTDLLANKQIEDPFYRDNEAKLQWIENRTWVYRNTVKLTAKDLASDGCELVFEGLDTYAQISINGKPALATDNMFRTWRLSLKDIGMVGDNQIEIRFLSPRDVVPPMMAKLPYRLPAANDDGDPRMAPFVRKAQYHFGWDWGPRYVTCGIWRDVYLHTWQTGRILATQYVTDRVTPDTAYISGKIEYLSAVDGNVELSLAIAPYSKMPKGLVEHKFPAQVTKGENFIPFKFKVIKPELWWPHTHGKPNLYYLNARITSNGKGVDSKLEQLGIRTITVEHQRDRSGKSFTVVVNGKKIFCKGANYIPMDNFLPRSNHWRNYDWLVKQAVAANMNMLRVWGGGTYEDRSFYAACDREGVLVWQDFMFACALYPGDKAFNDNVTLEALDNVKRLRNHPSIALWCGNNENEQGWWQWGFWRDYGKWNSQDSVKLWDDYLRLYTSILPSVVSQEDPSRFYHSSSPSANEFTKETLNAKGWGDRHAWGVWFARVRFDHYKKDMSRFISEYGFQSFPSHHMVEQFTVPADREVESQVMLAHQKHKGGNDKINNRWMAWYYRKPKDFDQFLYMSSVLQADAMKMALETHRYFKPYNWGSLFWQINDCWPAVSWSSIDYSGAWKATQYIARRANANLIAVPTVDRDSLRIYVVSDSLEPVRYRLRFAHYDLTGKRLSVDSLERTAAPNESRLVFGKLLKDFLPNGLADTARVILKTELVNESTGKLAHENYFYYTDAKFINLPEAQLTVTPGKKPKKGAMQAYTVTTNLPARSVFLRSSNNQQFSENYFDLLPGEKKVVYLLPVRNADPRKKSKEPLPSITIYQVATSYDRAAVK